jgi:uncharacterized protein YecT (DUF1311 family)
MRFWILLLGLSPVLIASHVDPLIAEITKRITETEIKNAINRASGASECESLESIHIDHLEYHDFFRDGQQEAVVVASTCATGTAGPDVHAVFRRDVDGTVAELPFRDPGELPRAQGNLPVFGNPNFDLAVEDGQLVARWHDSSDREDPLTVWFKWDGGQFVEAHRKVEGPFPTSYDCGKATTELDRAICYAPGVAALDVQLGQVYVGALRRVPPGKKQELRSEQREWLLRREQQCDIYKRYVDCLIDLYTKRIAELKLR